MLKKIANYIWNFLLSVSELRYKYYKKNPVAYY